MVAYPGTPADKADGDTGTARDLNEVYAALRGLYYPPMFWLYSGGTANYPGQTITTATLTQVTMDDTNQVMVQRGGFVSHSLNQWVLDSDADGLWMLGGWIRFENGTTGVRQVYIAVNGTAEVQHITDPANGANPVVAVTGMNPLSGSDAVDLRCRHYQGSDLDVLEWMLWGYFIGVT